MVEDYVLGNICINDGSWEGMLCVFYIYIMF